MGIIEYGRYVMTLQVVTNAARNGARYALAHVSPVILNGVTYGNGTSDVQNIVTTALGGQSLSGQNVQVFACDALGNEPSEHGPRPRRAGSICVQISGNYIPVISQFLYLPASIPVIRPIGGPRRKQLSVSSHPNAMTPWPGRPKPPAPASPSPTIVRRFMMFACRRQNRPRGVVAVLLVVSIFALMGFLALAIDLGMLAMAQSQLQDVSDAAAMAGCRALNGNTTNNANNNYAAVAPTATAVATTNTVMGANVSASQVSVNIGRWAYNSSTQGFQGQFPGPPGTNWSLVQATVVGQYREPVGVFQAIRLRRRQRAGDQHRHPSAPRYRGHPRLFRLDAVCQPAGRRLRDDHPRQQQPRHEYPGLGTLLRRWRRGLVGFELHAPLQRGQHHDRRPATADRRWFRTFTSMPTARRPWSQQSLELRQRARAATRSS